MAKKRKHPSPRAVERERERAREATGGRHASGPVPDLGLEEFGILEEEEELSEPAHMVVEVEEDLWPEAERTLDDSIYDRVFEGDSQVKRRRRLKKPTWKGFAKGTGKAVARVVLWVIIFLVIAVLVGTAIIAWANGTPFDRVPENLWAWILHVITG